jgi:hypothetical protein
LPSLARGLGGWLRPAALARWFAAGTHVFSPARSGPACTACLATYEPANATVQPFLETAASKTLVLARPPFGLPRSINIYMPQTNGTCVRKTKSRSTDQDNRSYYTIVPTRSVSPTHGRPRTGSHTHIHHS